MRVYFASPFFNDEQVERERRLVNLLRKQHFTVYAPSESCVLKPDATQEERDKVFRDNIKNMVDADIIFVVTDGKDIGTIWEAGFFYGQLNAIRNYASERFQKANKYIAYYCETLGDRPFNVMLAKSADFVFTKQEEVENFAAMILNGVKQNYAGKIQ